MNELINNLYKTIEAKDKIINDQALEIARLNLELSGYRQAILNNDNLLGLQQRIDKVIEFNKNILKESWYGGNEKEYAKTNLEILGDNNGK